MIERLMYVEYGSRTTCRVLRIVVKGVHVSQCLDRLGTVGGQGSGLHPGASLETRAGSCHHALLEPAAS